MQIMYQLLLPVLCAIGAAPVLGVPYKDGASWRLERAPFSAPVHRDRRQAYPGSGMPCVTIMFLTDMKGRFAERIDPNDDGKATFNEVRQYLVNFNPGVSDQQVTSFIRRRDLNGNGIIEFIPEYIMDIVSPDMTYDAALEWFGLEDRNGDGYVSRRELMQIAQQLGMTPQQAEAQVSSYYMTMDANGDDRLSFDEFKQLYGQ